MQTFRIYATIDIADFSEQGAVKEFHDLVRDNVHLGFSNGQIVNVEEIIEGEE